MKFRVKVCGKYAKQGLQATLWQREERRIYRESDAWVKSGRWLFLLLLLEQTWLCIDAAEIPKKWRQPKGADRTEMRKEEKRLKCILLNGSVWSTEKKYLRTYKGTFDIFFGIEHRLRKEEMDEQLSKEAKEGWIICGRCGQNHG